MKNWLSLLVVTLTLIPLAATSANADRGDVKDSIYFMMQDGEYSEEDMQEEALYVRERCSANFVHRTYYDCECLAGAFILEREKHGPMYPQSTIINNLMQNDEKNCANIAGIAGSVYRECMESSRFFRDKRNDNEEYCTCAANSTAKKFARNPYMRSAYITNLRADALSECNNLGDPERVLADQLVAERSAVKTQETVEPPQPSALPQIEEDTPLPETTEVIIEEETDSTEILSEPPPLLE